MRCANRRALDQSTGLETSLLLPLRLTFLSSSFHSKASWISYRGRCFETSSPILETIPPASAVYMMSLTSASQCHWILHRLDQERKDFLMDGMTHNCDTQVRRWKQNSDMQHDNAWQKVKKIRIEDLLSGFQHIQSLRVRNEWISCRSHVEKTEKQQTQQALVWRLEVNQFFDHLVKNGTVSQELLRGTYQKRSTRIPASRQSNSKTWWIDARTKL